MANRILLGNHGTYGYGLFISKSGVDVTGANKLTNIFDTNSDTPRIGQVLLCQDIDVAASGTTFDFASFNCNTFSFVYSASGVTSIAIASLAAALGYVTVSVSELNSTTSRATFSNAHTSTVSCVFAVIKEDL